MCCGNQAVIQALSEAGSLLKEEPYVHKYPTIGVRKADDLSSYGAVVCPVRDLGRSALAIASVSGFPPKVKPHYSNGVGAFRLVHIPSTQRRPLPFSTRKQLKRC